MLDIEECDRMIFQTKSKTETQKEKKQSKMENKILNTSLNNKCQVNTNESKYIYTKINWRLFILYWQLVAWRQYSTDQYTICILIVEYAFVHINEKFYSIDLMMNEPEWKKHQHFVRYVRVMSSSTDSSRLVLCNNNNFRCYTLVLPIHQ